MVPGRDENGRFVKGHKGGPGRPKRSTEERYLRTLQQTVKSEDWEKIVLTGISRAKAGDLGWAKFLADYLVGPPVQRSEISGANGGEIVVRIIGGFVPPDADGA